MFDNKNSINSINSINILLVDDEIPALETLKEASLSVFPRANIFAADNYIDALKYAGENVMSIAILDIEMPGMKGIELAKKLKNINPRLNIIFATAYDEYAYEASQLFASGYVLKPVNREHLQEQFRNLRFPLTFVERRLKVQCFGNFDIFTDDGPVSFERSKSKEILAYLIDRRGSRVTQGELISVLYEDSRDEKKSRQNFYSAMFALRKSLKRINFEEILIHTQNAYGVNTLLLDCDYYKYLEKDPGAIQKFNGQYMYQYSWAEITLGTLIK